MHHLHRVLFAAPVWKVTAVPVPKSGLSAYRLAYPCQREPAHYRALRRAFKLRGKLRAEGGIGDYVVKPKWMRWRTFERMMARIDKAEEVVDAHTVLLHDRLKRMGLGDLK